MTEPSSAPVVETIVCSQCTREFQDVTPPADVDAEFRRTFPNAALARHPRKYVCDGCYHTLLAAHPPQTWDKEFRRR